MRKMDVVGLHSKFFREHGFVLNHSQMSFEKVFPHGKQVVFFHLVEGLKNSSLQYNLGIRINAVEDLIHKYLPTFSNYADQSITLAQTPDKLGSTYPQKIKVFANNELQKVVSEVEEFFLHTGFKWLDEMIDPVTLEQEFLQRKENPFEDFNLEESAFRSTALSKLYNPKDYPILRQSFLEKINSLEMTPFTIASFLQFLFHLDKWKLVAT
ncbi:hypothetical protein C8N25_10286 [Algoriphagus antarcticus]|uniref:DUF4304 domain-containing protein n=3 Tax=Algoriphagus antarcticus TaxID=238540 RepID=A0A3E0E6R8_9BACT|nr:hypothetical protein C8N25_10286 [Algoriphagus antarcticus]